MLPMSPDMQACPDECLRRHQTCLGTARSHGLETGGRHREPPHIRPTMACAGIGRASAACMATGTDLWRPCARLREVGARSCEEAGDREDRAGQRRRRMAARAAGG